ncbi:MULTISPECIES: PDGLE domain-containing protein [unclassified Rhodococcus (in: high G+C Gram-positive bacteria)]|uniref:PDGLE domain-containing protein n=1 Tax=unclassified Rhodococcus (in: high G+C Gram-positive bacteria) TaxID=192944 RepID=UPI00163AA4CC|nr:MULTISPECIES: PDGLE domain-containing protein [unclassified Rhodococcus (in: high G+C Gram-positive bacteria)]MBC2642406.1 PDGLE domain-containing protein [Rhodococcus sp. 3A]MBC2892851.1 PDGLE domain-containing protein [Rhodococcus sp. 4CII]
MISLRRFLIGFALVALIIAGAVSYLASASPDGLDAATTRGCQTVETDTGQALTGDCIARNASTHHLSESPLADYTVGGRSHLTGIAGVIGVTATFAVAGGLFRLLARARRNRTSP